MVGRISPLAKMLLVVGVLFFAGSYYPNYILQEDTIGDAFDLVGTGALVLGACLIVRSFSKSHYVIGAIYTGAACLTLARVIDFTQEMAFLRGVPFVGDTGLGSTLIMRGLEGFGYCCVLLTMLAVLYELAQLKASAELEHQRYLELHEASLLLARVADMSAEAVFGFDASGAVRTWNLGAESLFGYTSAEAVGRPAAGFLLDAPYPLDSELMARLGAEHPLHDVELAGRTKQGKTFPAGATFSLVSDDAGQPVGVSVIVRDIEEQKRAERELIASRNLLSGALHSADVGMFIIRPDFELVEFNIRMEELTGVRWDGPMSMSEMAQGRFEPTARFVETVLASVFEQREPVEFRNLAVHRQNDNSTRICNMAVSPILGEDGQVVAAGGIAVDITDREALQARLLESQKLESLGRLAGGIAHDFNNILGGILGYASLLRQKFGPDSPYMRYIETIEDSANRASELTHQLLAFSRGGKSQMAAVQLNDLIEETVRLAQPGLNPNITVRVDTADDLPSIEADPNQVKQILMNLLINSRDAVGESGAICIATQAVHVKGEVRRRLNLERAGAYVRLTVSDDGCGMPQEVCDRIFEPFFSTKEKGSAYGLGLSVVYGIVQAHRGSLSVESGLGRGTEFEIHLPASTREAPAATHSPSALPQAAGGTETILVVDDERFIRALAQDVLTDAGYTVLCAGSGEEALSLYSEHRDAISLVLLDLVMPGIGGVRTLARLRDIQPDIRCIISSGHGLDSLDSSHFSDPMISFVPKPYQVEALTSAIRELLDS
ncbi:MAG: PAS domain S-box protein [bacterium]|nr:PAS domain S-box protein [bacterium]